MSQNPEDNRQSSAEEKEFESGLDYGAFVSDEPDFPEDHLDDKAEDARLSRVETRAGEESPEAIEESERSDAAAPAGFAQGTADDDSQPTAIVPPVSGRGKSAERTPQSPAAASAPSPEEQSTTALPMPQEQATATLPREEKAGAAAPVRSTSPGTAASPQSAGFPELSSDPVTPSPPVRHEHPTELADDSELQELVEKDKRGVSRFFTVLIAIFTPLMFIVLAIRLVASPLFLMATYWRPGFPEDPGGWELPERLLYGSYGTDFLLNAADSRYLAELAPGGEPLFTEAEVSHMADVKILVWYAMIIGVGLLLITLLLALLLRAWRPGGFARGLFAGAWATIGLMAAGVAVPFIIGWERFFTEFHNLFFPQGNWAFSSESALIRLYPEQFWIDAGIWLAGLLLLMSLITILITWPTRRRRERRAARLAEVRDRKLAKARQELEEEAARG
ncbi:lipoprotein intramolecular transacylase Lit [Nesterenkonia ebinurensis]|uniref:lipoprotein intramolecular transacylase Lit n=1 Tax=Nesterenkonia ebinurensis TaxID=2608252 RepID=UPI00168B65C7|nr:DUF1461 domain-containing protein [Nesterenkonia ebinurensis]